MRNYKRKTERGSTTEDVLKRAANEVANGKSVRGVANDFNINRMTLKRFISKRERDHDATIGYKATAQRHTVLSFHMEDDLAKHIKLLGDMFHGLTLDRCCILAYEFAVKNGVKIPESWEKNKKAGRDWWSGFKLRHKLSIRTPEATSFGRAAGFNRPSVNRFYDNLASSMDKYKFKPEDIYNSDETGCTTVQTPKQIVAERGRKQVGSLTSGERGELVTVVYTVGASGNVVPPMFIFPRVNYKNHFIKGSPPGSIGSATRSGWMNENLFIVYLHHLIQHTRCSKEHKILLILDNHESHVSLQVVDLAKENGIVMITLPPHTSHRLQPLDRCVYGPFKSAYNRAMDAWMRSNPGKTVTIYEIPEIVNEAHMSSMIPRNILAGFESTGIFPFNRDLFTELDYAPAAITDRDLQEVPEGNAEVDDHPVSGDAQGHVERQNDQEVDDPALPSTSTKDTSPSLQLDSSMEIIESPASDVYISPSAIIPVPKAGQRRKTVTKRKKKTSCILTDTPVRDGIAATLEQRKEYKKPSGKSKTTVKKSLFQKSKQAVLDDKSSSSESESEIEYDDKTSGDETNDKTDIIEGDFVVIKVDGKSRSVNYIARVDVIDDDEYEGVFLQKIPGKVQSEENSFVPNLDDLAFFQKEDIIQKLPQPKTVGGSARRSPRLVFGCAINKFHLA